MAVRWGPDLITIYNDAYVPLLGDKHPAALRQAAARGLAGNLDRARPAERGDPARRARRLLRRGSSLDSPAPRRAGRRALHDQLQPDPRSDPRRTASAASWSPPSRPPSACATRRPCACSPSQLEAEVAATHARARPHLAGVGGPARRLQLRGLFHQHQSGLDRPARLERGRDQARCMSASCATPTTRAPRCRARAARRRRADRAHGEPLPPPDGSWRWIAWTMTADNGAHLCRRPPRHRREGSGRAPARKRTAIPRAGRRRDRLRASSCSTPTAS